MKNRMKYEKIAILSPSDILSGRKIKDSFISYPVPHKPFLSSCFLEAVKKEDRKK